jgi:hypothetical protein
MVLNNKGDWIKKIVWVSLISLKTPF